MKLKSIIAVLFTSLVLTGCSSSFEKSYVDYYNADTRLTEGEIPEVKIDLKKLSKSFVIDGDIIKSYQFDLLSNSEGKENVLLTKSSNGTLKFVVFNSDLNEILYSKHTQVNAEYIDFRIGAIMPLEELYSHRILLFLEYEQGSNFTNYALIDGGEEVKVIVDNLFARDSIAIEYGDFEFNEDGFSVSRLGSHFDFYRFYLGSVQDVYHGLSNLKEENTVKGGEQSG